MKELASERDYDNWVALRLAGLSSRHRTAFAAAAGERQFGTYVHLARKDPRMKPEILRMALDTAWAYVAGEAVTVTALNEAIKQVEPPIPDLEASDAPDGATLV